MPAQKRTENKWTQWIRKDFWYLILLGIALLALLWTMLDAKTYEAQCNEYWLQAIQKCECACFQQPIPYNDNPTILGINIEQEEPYASTNQAQT